MVKICPSIGTSDYMARVRILQMDEHLEMRRGLHHLKYIHKALQYSVGQQTMNILN